MRMEMTRKLNGFNLTLKSSSDVGTLGDSRASEQSWGMFGGVEMGRADFGAFCCCKHGKNRPAVFLETAARSQQYVTTVRGTPLEPELKERVRYPTW